MSTVGIALGACWSRAIGLPNGEANMNPMDAELTMTKPLSRITSLRKEVAREVLAEALAEALWPTRCAVCDKPGELICPECASNLPYIDACLACPRCGAPFGRTQCTECNPVMLSTGGREALPLDSMANAVALTDVTRRIVTVYKDQGERRLSRVMAALMARYVPPAWLYAYGARSALGSRDANAGGMPSTPESNNAASMRDTGDPLDIGGALGASDTLGTGGAHSSSGALGARCSQPLVTFVPATAQAQRRRGFDHASLLAEDVARELGLECESLFLRPRSSDQRRLGRAGRAANMANRIEVMPAASIPPDLIVVDDVCTTGATLYAAADALRARGAARIFALTFARA